MLTRSKRSKVTMLEWIGEYAPCIPVPSSNIQILHTPNEFFSKLKKLIGTSRKRVVIAALYLEFGKLEEEIVTSLRDALTASNADFRVRVLLDFLRGTRGQPVSSTGMLQDLVDEYSESEKFQAYLYHTPDLRGLLRKFLPESFNESISVQHMKLYIFDDSMIISGANLSESYFTNRQDRYILIKDCPLLADFYAGIFDAVSRSSFYMLRDGNSALHEQCLVHPYKGDRDAFCEMVRQRIYDVIDGFKEKLPATDNSSEETVIYPLLQMATMGIDIEDRVVRRFLASNFKDKPAAAVYLATGYFNLTSEYSSLILDQGTYNLSVISAAPNANDFYGCSGMIGNVPALYTHALHSFYNGIAKAGRSEDIHLYEWTRKEWTFHAKGIWFDSGDEPPFGLAATFIGSSNYGYRSVYRDLEAQVVIVTRNRKLREQLKMERAQLFQDVNDVNVATFHEHDHRVKPWIRCAYRYIRSFF